MLVPGDIISIKLGDLIPANARLLEGDPLKIDQVIFCSILSGDLINVDSSYFFLISSPFGMVFMIHP